MPINAPSVSGRGTTLKIAAATQIPTSGDSTYIARDSRPKIRGGGSGILGLRLEVHGVHDHGGNRNAMNAPRSSQPSLLSPIRSLNSMSACSTNHTRADGEHREAGPVDPPPDLRRSTSCPCPRPLRAGERRIRRGAVGVGAEQVHEQEDEADEDHGTAGLYANPMPMTTALAEWSIQGIERRHWYSDRRVLTRFAPAPTGYLHLGHVVNALHVWETARDRQRPRPVAHRGPRSPAVTPRVRSGDPRRPAWLGFVATATCAPERARPDLS